MDTFGAWIQFLRKKNEMDLRTVSLKSGVHYTTINRIEKGQNDPTLFTAIRIAEALGGNPGEFMPPEMFEVNFEPYLVVPHYPLFPTTEDLRLFEDLITSKPKATAEYIAHVINNFTNLPNRYSEIQKVVSKQYPEYLQTQNSEQELLKAALGEPYYSWLDIHKIIIGNIIYQSKPTLINPVITYPEGLDVEVINDAFLNEGVLLAEDVIRYVEVKLDESAGEKFSDTDFAKKFSKAMVIKEKLINQSQISGMKISDFMLLDELLTPNHDLFNMVWNVIQEEIRVQNEAKNFPAARFLLCLSRHILHQHPEGNDWLKVIKRL